MTSAHRRPLTAMRVLALAALVPLVAAPTPSPAPTQDAPGPPVLAPKGADLPGFTTQMLPLGLAARLVEAGDLDGDSDIDLVVMAQDQLTTRTIVLRNHGASGFGIWWQDEIEYPPITWGLDLELGDLDEDGDLDLALNAPGLGLAARFNAGDATFDDLGNMPDQGLNVDHELADLDGDDVLDIAHYELDLVGYIGGWHGEGDGTFTLASDFPLGAPNQSDLRIALGDVTGDGLHDLLLAANLGLYQSTGKTVPTWFFPLWTVPPLLLAGGSFADVVTGDLDGDGRLDVAATSKSASSVAVLLGQPGGALSPPAFHPTGPTPSALALADIDADGVPDVVVLNRRGVVSVLLGTGQGGLAAPAAFPVGRQLSDVAPADLDGDGDIDLAVTDVVSGSVILMHNQLVP